MTTTPTSDQLLYLRDELGLVVSQLSDQVLTRFWARVDYANAVVQFEACCALLARSAIASLSNYHDYTTGNTSEKLSQVVGNLKGIYAMYKDSLEKAQGKRQIAIGVARSAAPEPEVPIENTSFNAQGVEFSWQELFS